MASALDDRVKAALSKSLQKIAELKGRVSELETQLETERAEHSAEVSRLEAKHRGELAEASAAATAAAATATPSGKKRSRQPTAEPKTTKKSGKASALIPPAKQKPSSAMELTKAETGKGSVQKATTSGGKPRPRASTTSRFLGVADPGAAFEETSSEDEAEAAPAQFKPTPKNLNIMDSSVSASSSSTASVANFRGKSDSLSQSQSTSPAELRSSLMEDDSDDSEDLDLDEGIAIIPTKNLRENSADKSKASGESLKQPKVVASLRSGRMDGDSEESEDFDLDEGIAVVPAKGVDGKGDIESSGSIQGPAQSKAVARLRNSLMDDDSEDSEDLDLDEGIETVPSAATRRDETKDESSTITMTSEQAMRDVAPEYAVDNEKVQGDSSSSDNDSDVEESIGIRASSGGTAVTSSRSGAATPAIGSEWREHILIAAKRLRKAEAKAAVSEQKQSENAYQQAIRQLKKSNATTAAEAKRKASLEATAASHAAAARSAFAARAVHRSRLAVRVALDNLANLVDGAAAEVAASSLGLSSSNENNSAAAAQNHDTPSAENHRRVLITAAAEAAEDLCFVVASFEPQCSNSKEELGPAWLASEIVTWWQYRLPQAFGPLKYVSANLEQPYDDVNGSGDGSGSSSGRSGLLVVKGSHDQHGGGLLRPHKQDTTDSESSTTTANAVAAVQAEQLRLASCTFVTLVLHATCPSPDNSQPLPDLLDGVCAVLADRVIQGATELHLVPRDELNQWRAQKDTAAAKARSDKKRRAKNKGGTESAVATSFAQAVAVTAVAEVQDESIVTVTAGDPKATTPHPNEVNADLDTSEDDDEEVEANDRGSEDDVASDDAGEEDFDSDEEEDNTGKEAGSAVSNGSSTQTAAVATVSQLASFASSLGPFVTARLMAGLGMSILAKQWSQSSGAPSSTSNSTGARWVREVIHRAFLRALAHAPDSQMHAVAASSGHGAARAATVALPLPELAGIVETWPGVMLAGAADKDGGDAEQDGSTLWCEVVKHLVAVSLRAAISTAVSSNSGNLQPFQIVPEHEECSKAAPSVGPVAQYFLIALEVAANHPPTGASGVPSSRIPSSLATTLASDDPAALLSSLVSLTGVTSHEDLTDARRTSVESIVPSSYELESLLRRTGLMPPDPRDWDGTLQTASSKHRSCSSRLSIEAQRALALVSRAPHFRAAARTELGSTITKLASSASTEGAREPSSVTLADLAVLCVLASSQRTLWHRFGGSLNLPAAIATLAALVAADSRLGEKGNIACAEALTSSPSAATAAAEALLCVALEDVTNLEKIITWFQSQRQVHAADPFLPPILAAHLPALFPQLTPFSSSVRHGALATGASAHRSSGSSSIMGPVVMECWVINLARRPDRWDALLRQAAKLNTSVHKSSATSLSGSLLMLRRCAAVDGTAGGPISSSSSMPRFEEVALSWDSRANAVYDSKCVASAALPLSASERACAASHLSLWRTLCRRPATHPMGDRAIILEDDVSLHTKFPLALAELWATLDKIEAEGHEWDICFLGYMEPRLQQAQKKGGKRSKAQQRSFVEESRRQAELEVIGDDDDDSNECGDNSKKVPRPALRRVKDVKQSHLLVVPGFSWGLHAYVLRRSGAAKLTRSLPIDAPVDVFVSSLAVGGCHLKAIALTQKVASQDKALGSDIAHSGMLRRGV